jgi:hypothetical protein
MVLPVAIVAALLAPIIGARPKMSRGDDARFIGNARAAG